MKRLVASLLMFFISPGLFSQVQDTAYLKLEKQLKKNLLLCKAYDERNYDVLEKDNLDIDSISTKAVQELTRLLTYEESRNLNPEEFPCLHLDASTDDSTRVRIYSIRYNSGGILGDIIFPVIQWTNKNNKLLSYNSSSILLWMRFNGQAYKLKSDSASSLYLFLGEVRESFMDYGSFAVTYRFEGDSFYTNYHAFANRNDTYLRFTNITYAPQTKIMHLAVPVDALHAYLSNNLADENNPKYNEGKIDTTANRRYYNLFMSKYDADPENYPVDHGIDLYWNGKRFVNIGPAKKADE